MPRRLVRQMNSLFFNGTSSFATIGAGAFPTNELNGMVTYSLWIYVPELPGTNAPFFDNNWSTAAGGIQCYMTPTGNIHINVNGIASGNPIESPAGKYIGRWVHVCVTKNANAPGTMILYIDGINVIQNNSAPDGATVPTTILNMGARGNINTFSTPALKCFIGETAIWNRVLSPAEVLNLAYNAVPRNGLLHLWDFSENSGSVLGDKAGTVNFTNNGGVWSTGSMSAKQRITNRPALLRPRRPVGELVENGDFELAPSFTAATNAAGRWIDGTAGGSAANYTYRWGLLSVTGSGTSRFDTTLPYSGINSLKVSTTAVASQVQIQNTPTSSQANIQAFGIPVSPSTAYTAKFYMKTQVNSGAATTGAFMDFVERGFDGTLLRSNVSGARNTTTAWQIYTVTFTTLATTRYITPKMFITGNDGTATLIMDAWFDNISLMSTTPVTRQLVV